MTGLRVWILTDESALTTPPGRPERLGWQRRGCIRNRAARQEEADIIAARFVRRVRATVTLSDQQADELGTAVGIAMKRCLLDDSHKADIEEGVHAAMINAGRKYLDDSGIAALKQAFSLGYQPLPGEK